MTTRIEKTGTQELSLSSPVLEKSPPIKIPSPSPTTRQVKDFKVDYVWGMPTYVYSGVLSFVKQLGRELPCGFGYAKCVYGEEYKGNWRNGKLDGKGAKWSEVFGRYEGEWLEGKRHGQGSQTYGDGSSYLGSFFKGKRHGEGVYNKHGDVFAGLFRADSFGAGQFFVDYANGNRYEGTLAKNGVPRGVGTMVYKTGARYKGDFEAGVPNGKGTFTYRHKSVYTGEVHNGKRHGKGVRSWPDGCKYEGGWSNGRYFGHGQAFNLVLSVDGPRYTGDLFNGLPHGKCKAVYPSGREYDGTWEHGKTLGNGSVKNWGLLMGSWKACYDGPLKDRLPHGFGRLTYSSGAVYEGHLVKGRRKGDGTLTMDGKEYGGQWQNDILVIEDGQFFINPANYITPVSPPVALLEPIPEEHP